MGKGDMKKDDDIELPEILPPTDDAVFKTLMTHPDTRDCLKDMIICYTGVKVQRVDLLNNELPVSNIMNKMERLDVNCVTDSRQQVNVEMQASRLKGDSTLNDHIGVKGRFVFNLCDLHSSQKGHGVSYSEFIRSYQITFLGYGIFSGRSNPFNWFTLRNEEGDILIDSINIGFIELTKLGDILKKPVSEMSGADSWAVFIKYADNPRYKGVIEELVKMRKEIAMANEVLTHISKDDHERAKCRSRQN
jgi:predicted transposase/invertase (TIGR01784 family)